MTLLNTAYKYITAGISVIGCKDDKSPNHKLWKPYQSELMDQETAIKTFASRSKKIGIVTGAVSANLEVIDIDDDSIFDQFYNCILDYFDGNGQMILLVKTPKGFHIYFRNSFNMSDPDNGIPCGNLKLAKHAKRKDGTAPVRIETRGQGGYVVAPPSDGYSIKMGSFDNIPVWSIADRDHIFDLAKEFNLYNRAAQPTIERSNLEYKDTPWTNYDQDTSDPWEEDLFDKGWTFVFEDSIRKYYLRPGESKNKYSANFHKGMRLFKCFSTSTTFEDEKPYRPSLIRCQLIYGDITPESLAKNTIDLIDLGHGSQWTGKERDAIKSISSIVASNKSMPFDQLMRLVDENLETYSLEESEDIDTEPLREVVKKNIENGNFNFEFTKIKGNNALKAVHEHISTVELKRNLVTNRIEQNGIVELDDIGMNSLYLYIKSRKHSVTKTLVTDYCMSNRVDSYHPFRDFFNSIEPINSEDYITKLFNSLNLSFPDQAIEININEEIKKINPKEICFSLFKKWLLQFPASSFEVGPLDIMMIFVGPKNNGKTYFFENLLPQQIRDKYITIISDFPKKEEDAKMMLCNSLMILLDDLSGTGGKSAAWQKQILSSQYLSYRAPYGRNILKNRRYAVLCATANDEKVIPNEEGNRRKFPLRVDKRDKKAFDQIANDPEMRLWREIKGLWKSVGEGKGKKRDLFRVNETEIAYMSSLLDFTELDPAKEIINKYFEASDGDEFMTTTDIMLELSTITGPAHKFTVRQIGLALRKMFEVHTVRINGSPTKAYRVSKRGFGLDGNVSRDIDTGSASDSSGDIFPEGAGGTDDDLPF